MGLFNNRQNIEGKQQIPTWFMRQAGRYHKHYQGIKRNSDFMSMCKTPDLATEITMGPIQEFDFDAAILFSDLLFPLDALGMGLSYENGPPELKFHLSNHKNLDLITPTKEHNFFAFQNEALKKIRLKLPQEKDLIGFVGAPFTLYVYAVEGTHKGNLINSKKGLYNGLYQDFLKKLLPILYKNMEVQAEGGPQALALFDTAAGELSPADFETFIVPTLKELLSTFKLKYPKIRIIYYSRNTHEGYLDALSDLPIDVLGIDWRFNLVNTLSRFSSKFYIQGNIDPVWLHLPWKHLENRLKELWNNLKGCDQQLSKLIFGLGHGVLPKTPEENVKQTVRLIHDMFYY